MGDPATEQDTPPPQNTFRRFVWTTIANVVIARAFFGRRLFGGPIGLVADAIAEATTQAFYARLPGHPQQSQDSLAQVGYDRDLFRFRGETTANYIARVVASWDDYAQAGTAIQVLKVVNQWGVAGWPVTWNDSLVTLVESGDPAVFEFTITIPFGLISPPWVVAYYGAGYHYGDLGLFYGVGQNTDLPTLLYLVKKWKRSTSVGKVIVFTGVSNSVTFTVR